MLQHNLRMAYRNIKRFKSTFLINLVGLSTGLACTLLIYLWVHDERSMDKFHELDDRLVQVVQNINLGDGGVLTEESTPALLGKAMQQELPQIEDVALTTSGMGVLSVGDTRLKAEGLYATPNFLTLFTYPLVEGAKQQALTGKLSIVLSDELARKLFGTTENLIGKTVQWDQGEYS